MSIHIKNNMYLLLYTLFKMLIFKLSKRIELKNKKIKGHVQCKIEHKR